jgi:hypothetical protein
MHDFLDPNTKKTYSCRVPFVQTPEKATPKNYEEGPEALSEFLAPLLSNCLYKV